jgi:hypothetical protein
MGPDDRAARGQSEVLGNLLMAGVAVVIVASLAIVAFEILGVLGVTQADTVVELEETDAGMVMQVEYVGQEADVRINGETVATINETDAGRSVYLPTAPGDRVTLVTTDDQQSILLTEDVDEGEAGDFVAYYTFDEGTGNTLVDRSTNDNDGTINGDPAWVSDAEGEALRFDGNGDYVRVDDITTDNVSDVEAFTVVVKFNVTGDTGTNQQLVEHQKSGGNEWFVETPDTSAPYDLEYAVDYPSEQISTGGEPIGLDESHVAVATYDGDTYRLYLDGSLVASGTHSRDVEMGRITIARDDESSFQHLEGNIYEMRIYYTAFDEDEVATITQKVR